MTTTAVLQLVLVAAAAVLLVVGLRAVRRASATRARVARARTASGEVVAVDAAEGRVVPTVRYHVGGERLEGPPRLPPPGSRYLVGQPVDVRYDPQEPAWMTIEAVQGDARVPRPRAAVAEVAAAVVLLVVAAVLAVLP
ncbi:DUF3592 domain-containing protein [Cellulomonas marina]|uniref:DUF3592 domain-containing protein n=1 Tax=Cellulomonas marina TaxID=988821 RepID=A0A1I0Z8E0_9CELL|nr:DUF3592 domain-containing protein [Cellulomonas marina]GIG29024.1 hypothetical protein Cma02nite_16240 [Cellulomonas marina]SFB22019.1 Protein of unknown function [Cellulomonas marina]